MVVPLIIIDSKLIKDRGVLNITDPDMTYYIAVRHKDNDILCLLK